MSPIITIIPVIFRPPGQLGSPLAASAQVQILTRNVTEQDYMTCLCEGDHMIEVVISSELRGRRGCLPANVFFSFGPFPDPEFSRPNPLKKVEICHAFLGCPPAVPTFQKKLNFVRRFSGRPAAVPTFP